MLSKISHLYSEFINATVISTIVNNLKNKKQLAQPTGGAAQYVGKINIPDSPYFKHPDFYNMKSNEHLTILSRFKTHQQHTEYTCGPTVAMMVVEHFLGRPLDDEFEIAKIMHTKPQKGTKIQGMSNYFYKLGWTVQSSLDSPTPETYEDFLVFVKEKLKDNTPIMVETVDWAGHWRVIIGHDSMGTEFTGNDVLILADPYDTGTHFQDGYTAVPAEKFFYMWFDAFLYSRKERFRPWVTAKPNEYAGAYI